MSAKERAGAQHHRGHADEKRADGGNRRVDLEDQAVPDAHRQRLDLDAGQEERDQELVERGQEGEERRRQDAGKDERQRDAPERGDAARAQAQRRLLEADVEALERGGHDDDDHGQRQHGMAQGHGQDAAGGLDAHEEEVEADGRDDGRHDHGRQQHRVDRALAAKAAAHQRQRCQEPQHGREDHGQEGDLRADRRWTAASSACRGSAGTSGARGRAAESSDSRRR